MESTQAAVKFTTHVDKVERRTQKVYVSGVGSDAVFSTFDLGWYVTFRGSHEALHIGNEEIPLLREGKRVSITIREIEE